MASRSPLIRFLRVLVTVPTAVAGAVFAFYLLLLGYTRLMRVRWVSDRTRQFSKTANQRFSNRIAGTRLGILYFNLAALHHVGRRSGRPYVTPLAAYRLGDGFVLALAYPHVDWADNVLAAGNCTLTWNGKDYPLQRPEVIPPSEALKAYPPLVRPFIVAAGMNKFLWLHRPAQEEF
jgi:deazaflavin-dependent oxidoreductase (nitroreductase family)